MQPHNDDQRTAQSDTDGGRDAQQPAGKDQVGVADSQVSDLGNRTVCLSAGLSGSGGLAA